jgi:hypothetical protein
MSTTTINTQEAPQAAAKPQAAKKTKSAKKTRRVKKPAGKPTADRANKKAELIARTLDFVGPKRD